MIETIYLAADTIIRLNNSTVLMQTQGSGSSFFSQIAAVFLGGIIALVANYVLQIHSFKVQGEANKQNQRMIAYVNLFGDITNYRTGMGDYGNMSLHMAQAAAFGSPQVRGKIASYIYESGGRLSVEFNPILDQIKGLIIQELYWDKDIPKVVRDFHIRLKKGEK